MTPKEFIMVELEKFIKQFPRAAVRYEHCKRSDVHFIEVVPVDMYDSDDNYIYWELETSEKFDDLFPFEGICFATDDGIAGIKNAEYTKEGVIYSSISTNDKIISLDNFSILLQPLKRCTDFNISKKDTILSEKEIYCGNLDKTYSLAA